MQCFEKMDCGSCRDLIVCLREIVYVYMTPEENVVKVGVCVTMQVLLVSFVAI